MPLANDVNTSIPQFLPDGQVFFQSSKPVINPNWGRTSILEWAGQAFYNSLSVSATRRLGKAFQVNGNYTWARNVDEGSNTIGGDFSNTSRQRQNPYDKIGDRGLASMNISHAFSVSYVYDLPFGTGQPFVNSLSGAAGKLAEGWQLQGIISGNSGPPFSAGMGSFDRSRSANLADRPNLKPGMSNNPVIGGPNKYFDPNAFVLQTPGFFGNLGRDTLIGPGKLTFDFSAIKNTGIGERLNLQFRGEFFNLFNRANFGIPGRVVFNSSGRTPGQRRHHYEHGHEFTADPVRVEAHLLSARLLGPPSFRDGCIVPISGVGEKFVRHTRWFRNRQTCSMADLSARV